MTSRRLHDWYERLRTSADHAVTRLSGELSRHRLHSAHRSARKRSLRLGHLEPRLLFSATPIDPAMVGGGEVVDTVLQIEIESHAPSASTQATQASPSAAESHAGEIVVIDSSVPDLQALLDDLLVNRPNAEVFVLEADRDGVEQISEILDQRVGIASLHIVSHGEDSAVRLGNVWLGSSNLDGYAGQLARWQESLGTDADILFYGCDLASDIQGREFLDAVAALTGGDVAASSNDTGHSQFNADWELEYQNGSIETQIAFSESFQANWNHKLASLTIYVDTFQDTIADDGFTSLREAIMAANANVGDDVTIVLQAGSYKRRLDAQGNDDATTGDFDITRNVTILGAGMNATTIDAGWEDRVFDIHNAKLTMSDLTLRKGEVSGEGGGIRVNAGAELLLNRAIIRDTESIRGGGIANFGMITLVDVEIHSGESDNEGGGIYNQGSATLDRVTIASNDADLGGGIYNATGASISMTNTTLSGNTSSGAGGGLLNAGQASTFNSTITLNDAEAGGGIATVSGTTHLTNTIIAGNTSDNSHQDVQGAVTSHGNNLVTVSDGSNQFIGSDLQGVSAQLAGLAVDGGFVRTHALQSSSPAIGGGSNLAAPIVDARGMLRAANNDIGAYQKTNPVLAATQEITVNTDTSTDKHTASGTRGSTSAIASDAAGNYVVVWTSSGAHDGSGDGVYGQRFNARGEQLGTEFRINSTTSGDQKWANVAMNDSGAFVVTWTTTGAPVADTQVMARRFNASGLAVGDEFRVSEYTTGEHQSSVVAIDQQGDFAIAWVTRLGYSQTGIFVRTYGSDAVELGALKTLDTKSMDLAGIDAPAISMAADGRFVVAWQRSGDIYFQRFDTSGNVAGGAVKVAEPFPLGDAYNQPAVAMQDDGSFVITWAAGTSSTDIYMQRFTASGDPNGSRMIVNSFTPGKQTSPAIAIDRDGNYIITWSGRGPGDFDGVFLQKYNSSGATVGSSIRVNDTKEGNQTNASLTMLDSDNFVVVWSAGDVVIKQYGTASTRGSNQAPVASADHYTIDENTTLDSNSTWFDPNWSLRRNLSLQHPDQPLNEDSFPVLVRIDAQRIDYSQTQNSGQDLRFIDSDGNLLAHDIELWDENGSSYVWVRVPVIDAGSSLDSVWMYYGNPAASDGQDAAGVWAGNAKAVYHLHDDLSDSTGKNQDGANSGSVNAIGRFGNAQSFDGVNDMITLESSAEVDNLFVGGGSVSVWFNSESWGGGGYGRLVDKSSGTSPSPNGWSLQVDQSRESLIFEVGFNGFLGRWRAEAGAIKLNTWQHVTVAYDSSSNSNLPQIYVDGELQTLLVSSAPTQAVHSDTGLNISIGNYAAGNRAFHGLIDEVRLIDGMVSTDWVAAQTRSENDELVVFGYEHSVAGVLGNDVDLEGNPLSAILVNGPSHAQAFELRSNGSFTYTPTADFHGVDTFTYQANDSELNSNIATVTITVNPVNDAPTLNLTPVFTSLPEDTDTSASIKVADVVVIDDALGTNALSLGGADAAFFELTAGGTELHLKAGVILDFETKQSYDVNVVVEDPALDDGPHDLLAYSLTITDINDKATGKPVVSGDAIVGKTLVAELGSIADEDGVGSLQYQWMRGDDLIAGADSATYTLTVADVGETIHVVVRFDDLQGNSEGPLTSDPTNVVVIANTAPTLENVSLSTRSGQQKEVPTTVFESLAGDIEDDPLTAVLVTPPTVGTLEMQPSGQFIYTPAVGFLGRVSFQWKANDGELDSNVATVTIDVIPAIPNPTTPATSSPPGGEGTSTPESSASADTSSQTDAGKDSGQDADAEATAEVSAESGNSANPIGPPPNSRGTGEAKQESANTANALVVDLSVKSQSDSDVGTATGAEMSPPQLSGALADSVSRSSRDASTLQDGPGGFAGDSESRALVMADHALLTRPGEMWDSLDDYQQNVASRIQGDLIIVGSAGAAASSFTVGLLAWAMRSGFLVSGLIAHMPAWSAVDPLLIMNGLSSSGGTGGAGNETLEELMQRQEQGLAENND